MSVRYLYKAIPQSKRLCSYYRCQKPILRNIARDKEGGIWHYGCLQTARDEQWRCLNCYNVFDATEAVFSQNFSDKIQVMCPLCGSINLRRA